MDWQEQATKLMSNPVTIRTVDRKDWEIPDEFFDGLDKEFHFLIDICASKGNSKCELYVTEKTDALSMKNWACGAYTIPQAIWCNPPYGRNIGNWVKKAYEESYKDCLVVMLLPARTDTKWFHDHIYGKAEIRFIKGRLTFKGGPHNAPFPSMVVIFRPNNS